MAGLDDSGVVSEKAQDDNVKPVITKKRRLLDSAKINLSNIVKQRRLSNGKSDSDSWNFFELNVSGTDFLTNEKIESLPIIIEDSTWKLCVRKKLSPEILVEAILCCDVPSPAWHSQCKISIKIDTESQIYEQDFECKITSESSCRGLRMPWKTSFLRGGRITAKLCITRICNKYLKYPDFTIVGECGHDELIVENTSIFIDKNLLSIHSSVFRKLFSKGSAPYRIDSSFSLNDVITTLRTVYPHNGIIDDSNVFGVSNVATAFELWDTLDKCESYLLDSSNFSLLQKIEVSVMCNMHKLLNNSRKELSSIDTVLNLIESNNLFVPSIKTKAYLFDVLCELKSEQIAQGNKNVSTPVE